jgi:hypothetical protein
MKAYLMHREADADLSSDLPSQAQALREDLGLEDLCNAMARGDKLIYQMANRALLRGLESPEEITYRQQILADCLSKSVVVKRIYELASEAVEEERKIWGIWSTNPRSVLSRGLNATELLLGYLRQLRKLADDEGDQFSSEGFSRFFKMCRDEMPDGYFVTVQAHLRLLRFPKGTLISAGLGPGNTGAGYVLHRQRSKRWRERLGALGRGGYSFEISPRDEAGCTVLDEIQGRALNEVANALAQSAEHVRSFFAMLRAELAFYVGCVNLRERLGELGLPVSWPEPSRSGEVVLSAKGLYDAGLALRAGGPVVGNDLDARGKQLVIITGANQGGKSTFLRSVGLAQIMMQAGMFVPAEELQANCATGIFTHFKREEDRSMESGKLDEELRRMSDIADRVRPGGLLLCNESFSSTNEREGSEIAYEVVRAMTEAGVKVLYVTHLFELADRLWRQGGTATLFLRAPRQGPGPRFKLVEGPPEPTAYGPDVYKRVFGEEPAGHPDSTMGPPGGSLSAAPRE